MILIAGFFWPALGGETKDLEMVLYRSFLQKLMSEIFPVRLTKTYKSHLPLGQISNLLNFDYTLTLRDPVLVIYPQYIQVNAAVDFLSPLGEQTFPGHCRFVPIFNKEKNRIEFKVTEGTVRVMVKTEKIVLDIGNVDISPFIANIKLPLEYGDITVSGRRLRPLCQDVGFKLAKDKIVVTGDIEIVSH